MEATTQVRAPRYARKAALCEYLDCGPTFIHNLVREGRLTPIRLSPRMTVYDLDEADALAAEARAAAKACAA